MNHEYGINFVRSGDSAPSLALMMADCPEQARADFCEGMKFLGAPLFEILSVCRKTNLHNQIYFDQSEAADVLRCSVRKIRDLMADGHLPREHCWSLAQLDRARPHIERQGRNNERKAALLLNNSPCSRAGYQKCS